MQYAAGEPVRSSPNFGPNWVIMVLPFLDQQNLYDQFDLNQVISHQRNRAARGVPLSVMLCPSDNGSRHKFDGKFNVEGDNWARGNYAASAGSGYLLEGNRWDATWGPDSPGWNDDRLRGIMGAQCLAVNQGYPGRHEPHNLSRRSPRGSDYSRSTWYLGDGYCGFQLSVCLRFSQ